MKDFDLVTIIKWVLIVIFAIGIGGPFGLLAIALYVGYQAAKKDKRIDEIISEPTPDTIDELMDILKKRIYHNHPDSWKKIRAKWHLINISEKIPTDSKEERLILLKAQLACLKGLKEQGCNGPVSQAIGDIEEYLLKKSHD